MLLFSLLIYIIVISCVFMEHSAVNPFPILEPNLRCLSRIFKVLLEKDCGRTELALASNLNYHRLQNQLHWLLDRRHVEAIIAAASVKYRLTADGREYGQKLLSLYQP